MKKEATPYQGTDRNVTFVRRYGKNPNYNGEVMVLPSGTKLEKRRFITTREWEYCLRRHREHWGDPKRTVPMNYREEGEEGWWFPIQWVVEFAERFRKRAA